MRRRRRDNSVALSEFFTSPILSSFNASIVALLGSWYTLCALLVFFNCSFRHCHSPRIFDTQAREGKRFYTANTRLWRSANEAAGMHPYNTKCNNISASRRTRFATAVSRRKKIHDYFLRLLTWANANAAATVLGNRRERLYIPCVWVYICCVSEILAEIPSVEVYKDDADAFRCKVSTEILN